MLRIATGFQLNNEYEALDSRTLYETVQDMANATQGIYEGCIAYVKTGNEKGYYNFSKYNSVDVLYGYWRPLTLGGGNVIDDTLESATDKTYSIDKIKQLLKVNGGYILVDKLPDLTDPAVKASIDFNKVYLVPNGSTEDKNAKDEYICIHVEARQPLFASEGDYTSAKNEIDSYVTTGGGNINDTFETFSTSSSSTSLTENTYKEIVESIKVGDTDFSAYTTRTTIVESWAWEKLGSVAGAGLSWSTDTFVNNPIGRIKDGDNLKDKNVLDIVAKMLQKDVDTTIVLTGTPDNSITYDKGSSTISDVTLNATINLGTGIIPSGAKVVFKKDGSEKSSQPYVNGTLVYTYTDTGINLTESATYTVEVNYEIGGDPKVAKDTLKYTFVLPMFYGTSLTSTVSNPESLTKIVSTGNKQTVSYSGTNAYFVFALPDSKTIKSLKDENGFENIYSWNYVTQSVNLGSITETYKIYVTNTPSSVTNFPYIVEIQ